MTRSEDRIAVIENSLRCFTWGLLGLIPLLGVGCSLVACFLFSRGTRLAAGAPNPARHYARFGYWAALAGLLLNSAAWGLLLLWAYHELRW